MKILEVIGVQYVNVPEKGRYAIVTLKTRSFFVTKVQKFARYENGATWKNYESGMEVNYPDSSAIEGALWSYVLHSYAEERPE